MRKTLFKSLALACVLAVGLSSSVEASSDVCVADDVKHFSDQFSMTDTSPQAAIKTSVDLSYMPNTLLSNYERNTIVGVQLPTQLGQYRQVWEDG